VADPWKVAQYSSLPPYRLDGVVVVADAETIRARSTDKYVGPSVLRQLQGADLIVLNKIDLITATDLSDLRAWIAERVPSARVTAVRDGAAPLSMLLGLNFTGKAGAHEPAGAHAHSHDAEYASYAVTLEAPIAESAFRAMVAAWPASVLRAKGVVHLSSHATRRHVFQLVGRRWSLTPDRPWNNETPQTQLVLIGLTGQFDGETLLAPLRQRHPEH
jgi:G3E family GTPase